MKKTVLWFAAAALFAAGCAVDVTKLTCANSTECPSGYHCDIGTGSAAGSFKCANGAPVQKTITVDATKFLLSQQSYADGTVRTTITADVGAVASTTDLVGVRAVASQGGTELASGKVLADGSVLAFQLPQAALQADLRVQDDSSHSVQVTGYREHVELNFLGKNVTGNKNGMVAFDAVSASDSLFAPQTWITTGGTSGAPLTELSATYSVLADGGISPPASYQAMQQFDGVSSSSAAAPQPDRDGGTVIGWEQIGSVSTTTAPVTNPAPRVGAAIATDGSRVAMYGGAAPDVDGGVVDTAGTWYQFNPNAGIGWTAVEQPPNGSGDPIPSTSFGAPGVAAPSGRANGAIGNGGTLFCAGVGCNPLTQHQIMVAGGTTSAGALTDHIYAYGDKIFTFTGSVSTYRGWWDLTVEFGNGPANKLPVPNAGMAQAATYVLMPVGGNSQQFHTAIVLVGGVNVPAGPGVTTAWDGIGCQVAVGIPSGSSAPGPSGTVFSCTTPEFVTTTGSLGFRSGAALTASDQILGSVYLFGGNRTGATTPALNGFKNDLWQGLIDVVCNPGATTSFPCPVGAVAQTRVRWQAVPVAGTIRPPARVNAGLAFADSGRLTVYGGSDASGNVLSDVWELDVTAATPQWRQVALDPGPALAPAARTKFALLGNLGYSSYNSALLVSGMVGSSPSMEVWALSKQAPSRLILKAPVSLPRLDLATNLKLSILSFGEPFQGVPLYIWDGSSWKFVANPNFLSGAIQATLPNATGFIQPDGNVRNVYLMYMHRSRSTPGFSNNTSIGLDSVQVFIDFN